MTYFRAATAPFAGMSVASLIATGMVITLARAPSAPAGAAQFVFEDIGDQSGLFPHVGDIAGHGAGWGDVDGDGLIDLYFRLVPL